MWQANDSESLIQRFHTLPGIKSRILKWIMMPKKILLTLEPRIQVMMKLEKLMKWTVFLQVHPDVVQKI